MKRGWIFLWVMGCSVGPHYETPLVCLPDQYEQQAQEQGWLDLAVFWKQFNDPLLDSLIEEALCGNLDLQIALHRLEEVRAFYRIESSALYPQLQNNFIVQRARRSATISSDVLESTASDAEILPNGFLGPLIQNFFQFGFDVAWEIDLFGKLKKRQEAALYQFQATQEETVQVQVTLITDVVKTYIDICLLQGQIENEEKQIERQKQLLELAESMYQAGLVSYVDVSNAKVFLEDKEAALPPLQKSVQQAIYALAVLIGRIPEDLHVEKRELPDGSFALRKDLPAKLLCRRADIRQAERQLAAATALIGAAKADFFPDFSLISSFGVQSNDWNELFIWPSRFWSIGPNMIWNLFSGGKLLAQLEVTNQRQKQAILQYEKVIHLALQEVEDRLIGYVKERRRNEILQEKVKDNLLLCELFLAQYESGLSSFDRVLDAENLLFQTKQQLLQSQAFSLVELVSLYKALGGGWECCELP